MEAVFDTFEHRVRLARLPELQTHAAVDVKTALRPLAALATWHPHGAIGVVVPASGRGYMKRPDVAPFLQELRCYCDHHGLRFIVENRTFHRPAFVEAIAEDESFAALRGHGSALLHAQVRTVLAGDVTKIPALAASEALITVSQANFMMWEKPWALESHLSDLELAVLLDTDVSIRPDAYSVHLFDELRLHSERQGVVGGHHAYVRDASPFTSGDCLNSGFVAVRRSEVGYGLLHSWQEKMRWPGIAIADQGALAESILELLAMERGDYGVHYNSECLPLLFPGPGGEWRWDQYCACWHIALEKLAGPYRHRSSRLVGFVDPQRIDVNFAAHTFFPDHPWGSAEGMLVAMRLLPGSAERVLAPFLVHWAGLGSFRVELATAYRRRFNASPSPSQCPPFPAAAQPKGLGTPPIPDAARRRAHCLQALEEWRLGHLTDANAFNEWWGSFGCLRLVRGLGS